MEPVRILRSGGGGPVIFYAHGNIHPAEECARRLATLREWADGEGLAAVEGAYDVEAWEATVGRIGDAAEAAFGVICNEEGDGRGETDSKARAAREARCRACYRLRFTEAARYAAEHGYSALGTTLSVSPYQYTSIIREELERACANAGIEARFEDYRPYYDEATRRSREGGMYRQNYCGCRFSEAEAAAEREERAAARRAAREAEKAARADERAAEEAERARKRAEKQAYADKQARKRAALKALREQQAEHD